MDIQPPTTFLSSWSQEIGEKALQEWLNNAASRLTVFKDKHSVDLLTSLTGGIMNWVIAGKYEGKESVIKVLGPSKNTTSFKAEASALRIFSKGAAEVYLYDEELEILVIEKLNPGIGIGDIEEPLASQLAIKTLKKALENSYLPTVKLRTAQEYLYRHDLESQNILGGRVFTNEEISSIQIVMSRLDLTLPKVLSHGDFHPGNVLLNGKKAKIIDPIPLAAPAILDISTILRAARFTNEYKPEELYNLRLPLILGAFEVDEKELLDWAISYAAVGAVGLAAAGITDIATPNVAMVKYLLTKL